MEVMVVKRWLVNNRTKKQDFRLIKPKAKKLEIFMKYKVFS